MRELYDRLIEEGGAGIDRLIAEKTQETLQLDFKRKEVDRNGIFSTNDRQVLAKALSGFANSAGGLLVIGVDARPGTDGIDCAQASRPIADIRRFLADAQIEVGQLVQPRLDGVSLAAIECASSPGSGFLLVHIERSERRPHRSEAKGQKGYFKRHGASFFEMEHYDIEDAFSRTGLVALEIKDNIKHYMRSGIERQFILELYMHNYSESIAKFPYVVIEELKGCVLPFGHPGQPLKVEQGIRRTILTGESDDVIHPGTERLMANLLVTFRIQASSEWTNTSNLDNGSVFVKCLYGCENGRAMRHQLMLSSIAFGAPP